LVYGEINGEIVFLKTAREDVLMVTINLCCLSHSHFLSFFGPCIWTTTLPDDSPGHTASLVEDTATYLLTFNRIKCITV